MELAHRIPLPASTSTFFISSDSAQSHLYTDPDNNLNFSSDSGNTLSVNESALPPVDKGLGAWSFVRPESDFLEMI
jgi:hypothetical protein